MGYYGTQIFMSMLKSAIYEKITFVLSSSTVWRAANAGCPISRALSAREVGHLLEFLQKMRGQKNGEGVGQSRLLLIPHKSGCPRLRGFRSLGTADLDSRFILALRLRNSEAITLVPNVGTKCGDGPNVGTQMWGQTGHSRTKCGDKCGDRRRTNVGTDADKCGDRRDIPQFPRAPRNNVPLDPRASA